MTVTNPRPWRTDQREGIVDAKGNPIAFGTDTGYASFPDEIAELIVNAVNDRHCPTCQGRTRETVNMICQTCGRDYMKQES